MEEKTPQTDLTVLIDTLNKIEKNQEVIIEKLTPTDEQLAQDKAYKEELNKLHDKQLDFYNTYSKDRYFFVSNRDKVIENVENYLKEDKTFKDNLNTEIKQVNKGLNSVGFNTQYGNNFLYFGLVIFIFLLLSWFIYKLIQKFI